MRARPAAGWCSHHDSGPGLPLRAAGIAEARHDSVPLLWITLRQPPRARRFQLQRIDQAEWRAPRSSTAFHRSAEDLARSSLIWPRRQAASSGGAGARAGRNRRCTPGHETPRIRRCSSRPATPKFQRLSPDATPAPRPPSRALGRPGCAGRVEALRALGTAGALRCSDLQRPRCVPDRTSSHSIVEDFSTRRCLAFLDRRSKRRSRADARLQVHAQRQRRAAAASAEAKARAGRRFGRGAGSQLPGALAVCAASRISIAAHDGRPRAVSALARRAKSRALRPELAAESASPIPLEPTLPDSSGDFRSARSSTRLRGCGRA